MIKADGMKKIEKQLKNQRYDSKMRKLAKKHSLCFIDTHVDEFEVIVAYAVMPDLTTESEVCVNSVFTICSNKEPYQKNRGRSIATERFLAAYTAEQGFDQTLVTDDNCFMFFIERRNWELYETAVMQEAVYLNLEMLSLLGSTVVPQILRKRSREYLKDSLRWRT